MSVKIQPPKNFPTLASMPHGSYGRRRSDGKVYYRTMTSAVCLDDYGSTYSECAHIRDDPDKDAVELLPRGTTITITVE